MTETSKRQQELESWEHFTLRRIATAYCQRMAPWIGSLTYTPVSQRNPHDLTDDECVFLFAIERADCFEASPNLLRSIDPNHPYRFPDDDPVVLSSPFYVERERKLFAELERIKECCRSNNDQSKWHDALDKLQIDLADLEQEAQRNIPIATLNDLEREVWDSWRCESARLLTSEVRQRARQALALALESEEANELSPTDVLLFSLPAVPTPGAAEVSRRTQECKDETSSDKQAAHSPSKDKLIGDWIDEGNAVPPGKGLNGLALKLVNFLLGEEGWTATIDASQCHLELEDKETKDGHRLRPFQREIHQFFGKNSAYSIGFSRGYVALKRKKK